MPPGESRAGAAAIFPDSAPQAVHAYFCWLVSPGPFSCTSWYLPPVWHVVDKLTQTMPSLQFYPDYRHLLQINKQNLAMQLMFIFFKDCICREKDYYVKKMEMNFLKFFFQQILHVFDTMFLIFFFLHTELWCNFSLCLNSILCP